MKNYLAIFFFAISAACSAQSVRLSTDRVCVDTIPYTIEPVRSGGSFKHRFVTLDCWTAGEEPVVITKIVQRQYGYTTTIRNDGVNSFPEKLEHGMKYGIKLYPLVTDSCTYVMYTNHEDSVVLKVYTRKPRFLEFETERNSFTGIDGQPATLSYALINRSGTPIYVDSIALADRAWPVDAPVPAVVAPGDTFRLRVTTSKDTGSKYMLSANRIEVHFHAENRFPDFVVAAPYVHYTHGVIISGSSDQNVGQIQNSNTLLLKTQVKNTGWRSYDLKRNQSGYARFSKNILLPGDTATVYVTWNPVLANDTFSMRIPLFMDTRNNQSTMVIRGTRAQNGERTSPDSMIWLETTHFSFDTLFSSKGRVEKQFKGRNNSPVPIIITQTTTGDGGSMAWATRDTIQPGEEFTVTFVQDLASRRRNFQRTVSITVVFLGTGVEVQKFIRVAGYVVQER